MKLKNLLPFFLSLSLCLLKGTNTLNSDEKELRLLDSSTDEISKLKGKAEVSCKQEIYPKALNSYQKVLKVQNKKLADVDLERAITLKLIGDAYQDQGKYDEATDYYEDACTIWEERLDNDSEYKKALTVSELRRKEVAYAELLYRMGSSYYELDCYIDAIENYESALCIYKKLDMKEDQGYTFHKLGMCYHNRGDSHEALVYYKKALKICKELDKKGKEYSETLEEIVVIHEEWWEYDQAIIHCEEMLNFLEKKQGKDSQKYLTTLNKIHYLHEMKNKSFCDLLYGVWVKCWECSCC